MNNVARQKYRILTGIFLLLSGTAMAQENSYIDSLQTLLFKANNPADSARILCQICWNISTNDPVKTLTYGNMALTLAGKGSDQQLLSEACDAAALGHWVNNDKAGARRLYRRSLGIGEKYHLADRIAWSNYNLAQLAMSDNRRDSAITYIKASQDAFREAKLDQWLINSYWLQAKLSSGDEQRKVYSLLLAKIDSITQVTSDPGDLLFHYLDMAKLYIVLENQARSVECVLNALEIAQKSNNIKGIISAYSTIGDYLRDIQHNHKLALQYYQRTLEMYQSKNIPWGVAEAMLEIGLVYKEMNNDSLAIYYLEEAGKIIKPMEDDYTMARIQSAIGEIYLNSRDYKKALDLLLEAEQTITCRDCMFSLLHTIIIDLGQVYTELQEPSKAYAYFKQSFDIADSANDSQLRASSLICLADWFSERQNTAEAEKLYLRAGENARTSGSLNLQIISKRKLRDFYSEVGRFGPAYSYQMELARLEDSLQVRNETNNLARLENLFELENLRMQKEVDRAVADAKIERNVLLRNFFIAGFILMTFLGIYLFISFRRKKQDNKRLAEQKEQIEKMSEKMHEVDEMKLEFFTNISHELRTPLTLITGLAEQLITTDTDRENLQNKLKTIHKNAARLHLLVNQILDIRKLDNGSSTIQLVKDDLVNYIAGVISNFNELAGRKEIELVFVSAMNKLIVNYDFDKLEKILSNLISNAINFCTEKDTVKVSLYTRSGTGLQCILEVEDTGQGIPADQLKFIFQPFYQASNAQGGSGLGLALVRELVRVLNGQIDVESKLNKGTRITLRLPVETTEENQPVQEVEDAAGGKAPAEKLSSVAIQQPVSERNGEIQDERWLLIVEDNQDLQDFITDIMSDEFKILNALDGENGAELAFKHIPDIIICDIMMPGMNGIELCEKLKNTPCTSHIPILMLTAKTDQESMLKSFRTGADDYIIKPFSATILKTRVKNLVDQRRKLMLKFSQQFMIAPAEIVLPDADKLFLEKIIRVIEENMAESTLDIDFLASEMNISRTQLYRKLKALTDLSGNQFIRTIRLKRAAQLLSGNQLSIAEVMQETGFSNYSHFNTCFREQFNKSPKEYSETI